ncbi:MAG TPA: signal peptidase I [Luteimonas sp.]|nr:signal peptidase I [Luteimonas sp.]
MKQAVAASNGLVRRNGALALLLTFFAPLAGFAYVRELRWGVALVLLTPALMLLFSHLGLLTKLPGVYALMGLMCALALASLALAFRFARALPVGTERRWYNRWYHYVWLALLGLLVSNLMVTHRGVLFGYETFRVASTSMQPTLMRGDFIAVDTRDSTVAAIGRGDIVTYVPNEYPDQAWLARVVGLPGESIVAKDNVVEVNGVRLPEPYLGAQQSADPTPVPVERVALGSDEYFLMGDNRPNSADSRFQGPVTRAALRGKARAIWFSYSPTTHSIDTARIGTLPSVRAK